MKKSISIKKFVKNNPQKGNLVFLKIKPIPVPFSCCSHSVPELWEAVNDKISPQGPIEHEGAVILNIENEQVILEQHESGPLIKTFLISLATAAVYDLVKWLLLHSVDAFSKKGATKTKIIKKITTTKQKVVDEAILEIDLNQAKNGKELDKTLNKFLNKIIK
jgi:hypothetical protein